MTTTTRNRIAVGAALGLLIGAWYVWRTGGQAPDGKTAPRNAKPAVERRGLQVAKFVAPGSVQRSRISGTVTDASGAAVAGAQVCSQFSGDNLSSEQTLAPVCVVTDVAGDYALDNLHAATHHVIASAPRFRPTRYHDNRLDTGRIVLAPGEHRGDVDIVLRGGGVELRGVVNDIGGGPVAGATVMVRDETWSGAYALTTSNDSGEFATWVPPGGVYVHAVAPGYTEGGKNAVAPGTVVTVLLTPESALAGRVVDAHTKQPVANAEVFAGDKTAFTNDRGAFRMAGLSPGRYKPEAKAAGLYGKVNSSVRLGLGETRSDVVIELHAAFVVTGRVLKDGDASTPCRQGRVGMTDKLNDRTLWANITGDGAVKFKAVLPGTYNIDVDCDHHLEQDRYDPLVISDKDALDVMWSVTAGAEIRGRVIDNNGEAVGDANVRASMVGTAPRGQRSWGWDQTDARGEFSMKGLVAGTYELAADSQAFPRSKPPVTVTLESGATVEATIKLAAGGSIAGIVVDEHGTAVSDIIVRARGTEWSWRARGRTADDGTFSIPGVRAGEYRVVAQRSWRQALRKPGSNDDDVQGERVRVRAGEAARVRLVVESQTGTISGVVVDATGHPVADAFVAAERESQEAGARRGSARRSVRWDWQRKPELTTTDGKFTLNKLAPGTYTVRAYRRGGGEGFVEGVKLGAHASVRLDTTGSIAGRVDTSAGAPPQEFTISVVDQRAGFSRTERFFRSGGDWVMRDIPAGEHVVSVRAADGNANQTVQLAAGEHKTGVALMVAGRVTVTGRVVGLEDGAPLAGMYVRVDPIKGAGSSGRWRSGDNERKNITEADGRFEVKDAPLGRVYITAGPMEWRTATFGWARAIRSLSGASVVDVGDIAIPKRRTAARERPGDLGFTLKEADPAVEVDHRQHVVAHVRPGGPAAGSGLNVGDVITHIDGHDVSGEHYFLYWGLARVTEGRSITLGLKRGQSVTIRAGKPL